MLCAVMPTRLLASASALAVVVSASACSSGQKRIEREPTRNVDKSSASWEEPGAVADEPLDAGGPPSDAGANDAGGDAALPDGG